LDEENDNDFENEKKENPKKMRI